MKELQDMESTPPEGIKVLINESDVTDIQALIDGPAGTPYAVGVFRVKLTLSKDFPQTPPKAYFLTKIFHPNVAANGEICVNTLKKDWKPDLGIKHILLTIKCLLIVPNPESALNEEAGKMLLERYDDYSQRARMMTEIHAQVSALILPLYIHLLTTFIFFSLAGQMRRFCQRRRRCQRRRWTLNEETCGPGQEAAGQEEGEIAEGEEAHAEAIMRGINSSAQPERDNYKNNSNNYKIIGEEEDKNIYGAAGRSDYI